MPAWEITFLSVGFGAACYLLDAGRGDGYVPGLWPRQRQPAPARRTRT